MGGTEARAALIFGIGLAWLAGVGLQLNERMLWPDWAYTAGLAVALLGGVVAWRWPRLRLGWVLCVALAGFAGTGWHASSRLAESLAPELEGRDLQVTGVVSGLPQRSSTGLRFRFEVESAEQEGQPVRLPPRLSLGWYTGFHEDAQLSEPQMALRAGQRWRFTLRLRQPHGNVNPNGFDYELYLFELGLRATGYVRDAPPPVLLGPASGHWVDRARQQVRDAIEARVTDPRAAGVLAALAVGDQAAIERDDWQLFRDTGIAHLVSISGLHVTMFAWLASLVVGALWRRSTRAMLWCPAPLAARALGLAAAAGYAVFSGWGVPAQRTVWMLATVVGLQWLGRRWPWPRVLVAAAVVVSVFDPWALLQPGFWLSFVAVGLLMASEPVRREPAVAPPAAGWPLRALRWGRGAVAGGVRTQVIATLGLAPLTLVFFQQLSLVGFAANLGAIPLVTLVITPLALLGVLWPALWAAGAWVVQALALWLEGLAAVPGAVWTVPAAPLWAQAAALLGAVVLLLPLPWRLRLMAVPLVLPLLLPPTERPADGSFELMAMDVGQGTAVLVRTRHHLLVYDAGPQYARDSDAGQRVLLPLLRSRGETRIDTLLLSHRDLDHVGGAAALMKAFPLGELLSSLEEGHPLRAAGVPARRCEAGQAWVWDGVRFELLHPQAAYYGLPLKSNAMSCVLKVSAAQGSALLTGDVERAQEDGLVQSAGPGLKSDMLLVPHHGTSN